MAHRKSVMLLLRIARGESVGITFGTPVCHKIHHAHGVLHHYMTEQVLPNTAHLSHIISVLVIPMTDSYAFLGYARNNSE